MLVVKLFDQLKQVVVDLFLVPLCNLLLFLTVHVYLGPEHGLTICPRCLTSRGRHPACALPCQLLKSTLRNHRWHHCSVSGLLLDCDDNFPISFALAVEHLGHTSARSSFLSWSMRWRV